MEGSLIKGRLRSKNVQKKKQTVRHSEKEANSFVRQVKYLKMATDQTYISETIAQIVAVVAKAVVQVVLIEREMKMNLPGTEMKKQK